jgi:hypothetical protein
MTIVLVHKGGAREQREMLGNNRPPAQWKIPTFDWGRRKFKRREDPAVTGELVFNLDAVYENTAFYFQA